MKKTIYLFTNMILYCLSLVSCKNEKAAKIGEIHTNDIYSNKIAAYLKASEAKDSTSLSSLLSDDFKLFDETSKGWVDNDYFKDTAKGFDKKPMIDAECQLFRMLNNIQYENPAINTVYYSNGDTCTIVKAFFNAEYKRDSTKIHNPYYRIFKWKNGKVYQILKYTEKFNVSKDVYGYETSYGNYGYADPSTYEPYGYSDSIKTNYHRPDSIKSKKLHKHKK